MQVQLMALTINSPDPQAAVGFYTALGFQFREIPVSRGGCVYRAKLGELEMAIMGVVSRVAISTPVLQLAFKVADLPAIFEKVRCLTGVNVLLEPTEFPDGMRAIVADNDGNAVEISQG
jgi:predicted enzyme related to lactoylglutathione lyase